MVNEVMFLKERRNVNNVFIIYDIWSFIEWIFDIFIWKIGRKIDLIFLIEYGMLEVWLKV